MRPARLCLLLSGLLLGTACGDDTSRRPAGGTPPSEIAETPDAGPVARGKRPTVAELIRLTEPLVPRPKAQRAGERLVRASACKLVDAPPLRHHHRGVIQSLAIIGRKLYLADHADRLWRFDIGPGEDCELKLDPSFGTAGRLAVPLGARILSRDGAGRLVASSLQGTTVLDRSGRLLYSCRAPELGRVEASPTGHWGIGHFIGATVRRVELGPRRCQPKPWALRHLGDPARRQGDLESISAVGFHKDLVLVGGQYHRLIDGWRPKVVVALTADGTRQFRLGRLRGKGEDIFGWVHQIRECPGDRICVVDSIYRRLSLWSARGEFWAAIDLARLLGLGGPWIAGLAVTGWGDVYVGIAKERRPRQPRLRGHTVRLAEALIYRVRGL